MSFILEGDIKFFYGTSGEIADVRIIPGEPELQRDPGLETAVTISVFTDRRADTEDKLPDKNTTKRGWWGDALTDVPIGSKIWLLERAKLNGATLKLLEQYTADSLQSMIDDKILDSVDIVAQRVPNTNNRIEIKGKLIKEDNANVFFQYFLNWNFQITGKI